MRSKLSQDKEERLNANLISLRSKFIIETKVLKTFF